MAANGRGLRLALVHDQHRLSLGCYGRRRMTEELDELGLQVGQRRVGRLMRQSGIQVVRNRKFKVEDELISRSAALSAGYGKQPQNIGPFQREMPDLQF